MLDIDEVRAVFAKSKAICDERGFPPGLGMNLWSWDALSSFAQDETSDILTSLPPHDVDEPPERAAVASLLMGIPAIPSFRDAQADEERPDDLRQMVRDYLGLVPVENIQTLSTLRWELHAAAVARDVERILSLAPLWERHDPDLKYLHLVPRTLFLLLTEAGDDDWPNWAWDPEIPSGVDGSGVYHAYELLALCRAALVGTVKILFVDHTPDGTERVPFMCLSLLERLGPARCEGSSVLSAVGAWCDCAVGTLESRPERIRSAAERYESLAPRTEPLARVLLHRAAIDCYAKVGDWNAAERNTRAWVALAPGDAQAHRRSAEFLYKQGLIPEAIASFEEFVKHSDESKGEDWSASLLLQLGLEHLDQRRISASIESAALVSPWRPQGEALLDWLSPWATGLSDVARRRWWTGLYLLTSPAVRAEMGQAAALEQAGDAFGEAANLELRHSVFGPWRSQVPEVSVSKLQRPWVEVFRDRSTLGNSVEALLETRNPNTQFGRRLAEWLWKNKRPLGAYIKTKSNTTFRCFVEKRGAAQHPQDGSAVSPEDVREIYDTAAGLLQAILQR